MSLLRLGANQPGRRGGRLLKKVATGALFALSLAVNPLLALAQSSTELEFTSELRPVASESIVFIFSDRGISSVRPEAIEPVGAKQYRIRFTPQQQVGRGSYFSVQVGLENGGKHFLPAHPLPTDGMLSGTAENNAALIPPPLCPRPEVNTIVLQQQQGLLESLVEVRKQRQELARKKLQEYLSPEKLKTLSELESGFGLSYPDPLSASMSPYALVDRLFRIKAALGSFRLNQPSVAQALQNEREAKK